MPPRRRRRETKLLPGLLPSEIEIHLGGLLDFGRLEQPPPRSRRLHILRRLIPPWGAERQVCRNPEAERAMGV